MRGSFAAVRAKSQLHHGFQTLRSLPIVSLYANLHRDRNCPRMSTLTQCRIGGHGVSWARAMVTILSSFLAEHFGLGVCGWFVRISFAMRLIVSNAFRCRVTTSRSCRMSSVYP